MNQVKIEVSLDAGNEEHRDALSSFLKVVGGPEVKKPATRTTRKKKPETVIADEDTQEDVPDGDAIEEQKETRKNAGANKTPEKETPKSKHSIEDVREMVSTRAKTHRTEVKEALTRMGANNVTSLDSSKYDEFMEFLTDLK